MLLMSAAKGGADEDGADSEVHTAEDEEDGDEEDEDEEEPDEEEPEEGTEEITATERRGARRCSGRADPDPSELCSPLDGGASLAPLVPPPRVVTVVVVRHPPLLLTLPLATSMLTPSTRDSFLNSVIASNLTLFTCVYVLSAG